MQCNNWRAADAQRIGGCALAHPLALLVTIGKPLRGPLRAARLISPAGMGPARRPPGQSIHSLNRTRARKYGFIAKRRPSSSEIRALRPATVSTLVRIDRKFCPFARQQARKRGALTHAMDMGMGMAPGWFLAMTVDLVSQLDRNDHRPTIANTAFGDHLVGTSLHRRRPAFQQGYFHTALMVEMQMQSRVR
jgi:hypothetical protein